MAARRLGSGCTRAAEAGERRRQAPFTKSGRCGSPAGRRPPPSSSRSWFYEWAWRREPRALFTPLFVTSRPRDWARAAGTPFTRPGGRRGWDRWGEGSREGAGSERGGRSRARDLEWKEAGPREVVMNLPPPGGEQRSINKSISRGEETLAGADRVAPAVRGERRPEQHNGQNTIEATTERSPWSSPVNTLPSTATSPLAPCCLAPEAARTAM